jgi:PAS domain S-box-containing protein
MRSEVREALDYPFLAGGGETGELIRSYDWSSTPLGTPDQWPQSLKTCVRIILTSRQPMFVWWGEELINIYNDAYIDIVRGKHPEALGQPAAVVWREIWDQVGPRAETVMKKNEGTYDEALLLIMERNGYPEETYYTFSYSPVPGDNGGTAGIICANTDDTERIIGEHQLTTLKDLGKAIIDCKTNEEVFGNAIEVLRANPYDFPFAFLYELNESGIAQIVEFAGAEKLAAEVPRKINIVEEQQKYPSFLAASINNKAQVVKGLTKRFGNLPSGAWDISPDQALVLPISQAGQKYPFGFLSVGLNPYRLLDEKYISFFQLVSDQIATALSSVHAYEEERKRVEALEEIDRAKTAFFSNISHEFRTPLTLMLSPLREIKNREHELPQEIRENIGISYRNTLRLQKLVNTLLDFSRIEAGRMQARYEATDLAEVTEDIASSFRSAIESAGMKFVLEVQPLSEPVYVDVDMWEKVVLNLVSNAFKYTEKGTITVSLRQQGKNIQFSVKDTGVGIPEEEVSKIFERFHRIENVKGRSQEGTGIGLALVQELVKLHHGNISVKSKPGKGSEFLVSLPLGSDHLPQERILNHNHQSERSRADAYVEEALKWLPDEKHQEKNPGPPAITATSEKKPRVLLADDNADMRNYVRRLLSERYEVEAVSNGRLAVEKIYTEPFDLILSDVMMPEIDGFELIKKVRQNNATANIPFIMLSARAGEEATIQGLQAGADDYLVKPFSAKELLERVHSNIRIAAARNLASQHIHNLFAQAPVAICILRGPEMVIELANDAVLNIWRKTKDIIGKPLLEGLPEIAGTDYPAMLKEVYEKGVTHYANEMSAWLERNKEKELVYFNFVYQPLFELDGSISGVMAAATEVTEQVQARRAVEDAEERLRMAAEGTGLATWDLNLENHDIIYSPRLNEIFGHDRETKMSHAEMRAQIHPDDLHSILDQAFDEAMNSGFYSYEARVLWLDGATRWIRTRGKVSFNEEGKPVRMLGTMMDITNEKEAEIKLRESQERYRQLAQELEMRVKERTAALSEANSNLARSNKELEQFAFIASHDLQEPLRKIQTFGNMLHENYSADLHQKGKDYLDKMLKASQRMSTLISALLNFSRLRQSEDEFVPVNLNEVLEQVRNDFELVIRDKGAVIDSSPLPTIEAHPLQMNQLFYNLISNALKFVSDNVPPRITIRCRLLDKEDMTAFPGLDKTKTYYQLSVEDNGIGFPQEYAEKIFEIFQRLNARSEYEGTGIGLALVNKIAENHKGRAFARSSEGKGSTFFIVLPEKQD